jgi:hypothetical protein
MIFRISACRRRPGRDQARSRPARTAQRRYPPACAPGEVGLAQGQRQAAQVLAIERHDVEGVELHLVVMLAGMQGVEVCDAVDAEHDRLAVEDEGRRSAATFSLEREGPGGQDTLLPPYSVPPQCTFVKRVAN